MGFSYNQNTTGRSLQFRGLNINEIAWIIKKEYTFFFSAKCKGCSLWPKNKKYKDIYIYAYYIVHALCLFLLFNNKCCFYIILILLLEKSL